VNPADFSKLQHTTPVRPLNAGSPKPRVEPPAVHDCPKDGYEKDKGFLGNLTDKVVHGVKTGLRKTGRLAKTVASGTWTALQVAPTLITLTAAAGLAKAEGVFHGRESVSAIEWLREKTPRLFNHSLNNLFKVVGNSTVNSTGLSVDNLVEIEEHIYKSLAPEKGPDGVKKPAHFISQLAAAPFRKPGASHAAFVYLGEGREKESKDVMKLWNGDNTPAENPYDKKSDLHRVWEVLEEKASEKKLPVFIDLDGDANTFTSTEYISKEIMNSMVTRHNQFGDGFQDAGLYYTYLNTRQESFYQVLDPWMASEKPGLHGDISEVKELLTPPWLGASEGLGPWATPRNSEKAFQIVEDLASNSSKGAGPLTDFADTLVALDRDVMTGTMTHWIKLLKSAGSEKRSKLLAPLAKAWVDLNVASVVNEDLASPKNAPQLRALEGPPPEEVSHRYDRAIALGEVVDHTLDGLGVLERKEFMDQLKSQLKKNLPALQGQDRRLSNLLGDRYGGIDLLPVVNDRLGCHEGDLHKNLGQLKEALHTSEDLSSKEQAELHRHYVVADWLINSQKRYGDIQFGLIGHAEAFKENPLSVSQFFDQMEQPSLVTMLGPGPTEIQQLGNADSPHEMRVSLFREGGGGKGLAYPTPTRALKSGLKSLNFKFDDGGGNSAGTIPSLLEAAGFNDDEIEEISARLDFKEFNADAIPLMGATDPKIGGINHTGMFSSQKMYKELYQVLSQKLGIEGRPVLFRDLPQRVSMAATVMNTDLPEDDPLRSLIDDDKRMIMSSDTTPNFDVVGAITASTAVPGYFNAPQMQVARSEEKDGKLESKLYRIQFVDGGVVDNFPISAAKKETEGKTALVVVPAYYEGIDPESGEKLGLSTLNFDDSHIEAVNRQNEEYYAQMMPKLDSFLAKAQEQGYSRVVLAMNLTDLEEQTEPLIQGQTKEETESLLALADSEGLGHMSASEGRKFMQNSVNGPSLVKKVAGGAFNLYLDGHSGENNELAWGLEATRARVGTREEENVLEVIRGVGSSALSTSKEQAQDRLFEV
jgi:predicted acylesterase/phospholipase RssA